jgi:hypothetical protein
MQSSSRIQALRASAACRKGQHPDVIPEAVRSVASSTELRDRRGCPLGAHAWRLGREQG